MKAIVLAGPVLLLLATAVPAMEATNRDNPSSRLQPEVAQMQTPSQGTPGAGGDQGSNHSGGPMAGSPEAMQHMHEMMMRRMKEKEEEEHQHAHSAGTFIRLKRGDSEIAIRCGESESIRDCVSAAMVLFDKLASSPGQQSPSR